MENKDQKITAEVSQNEYPIRLNKYLAMAGVASRRGADELIEKGLVFVNGEVAELGKYVRAGDSVTMKGGNQRTLEYFAVYKAKDSVIDASSNGLVPADFLEKSTDGLVILTNDGRLTRILQDRTRAFEREYMVKVQERVTPTFLNRLEQGITVDGIVMNLKETEEIGEKAFKAVADSPVDLKPMCEALHHTVTGLRRTRIANVSLKGLKSGDRRKISGKELELFLKAVGLEG